VNALLWVVAVIATALPVLLFVGVMLRSSYLKLHLGLWLATMGAAAALVVPVTIAEQVLQTWAEIDPTAGAGGQVTLLLYGLLVAAPLEMGVVALAVVPFWRLRRVRMRAGLSRALEVREGTSFAVAASVGFSAMRNVATLWLYGLTWLGVARSALWTVAFALLCSLWGYVLGRYAHRGMTSKRFSTAWIVATIFSAVCDQLIFRRGLGALIAVLPLLLSMMVVAWVVWRDARGAGAQSSGGRLSSLFTATPAPSLSAIRDAFRQQDRPITLRWITFGAFVTTGLITTGLVVAVWTGHRIGLDFSAVDQQRVGADAMGPLMVLGAGTLGAFPTAGYLLARASGTRSVLEPAMAAALAMVLVMVFMGMLAPVSVVFAIAFSPVALALSCVGAWVGLSG
jgi:hypothetical protein